MEDVIWKQLNFVMRKSSCNILQVMPDKIFYSYIYYHYFRTKNLFNNCFLQIFFGIHDEYLYVRVSVYKIIQKKIMCIFVCIYAYI